jgi:hypothetical protein
MTAPTNGSGGGEERRLFPILGARASIDFALVADHGKQAQANHYQTVERLAQRGGLSWCELYAVLHNKPWQKMDTNDAMVACRALESRYLAAIATPPAQVGAATDSGEGVRPITAAELGEIMQDEWGEICEDAQAHPSDIRREGRKLFYDPRHWTDAIARRLNERLASPTKPVADSAEAVRQSLDNAVAQVAAEAIRSSFFVSVSGEDKPYRYHLRLSYPTMEAMHEAEDALKRFAKHLRFQPLATRARQNGSEEA